MMPKIGYLRREGLLLPGGSVSSFSKMRGEGLLLTKNVTLYKSSDIQSAITLPKLNIFQCLKYQK